MIDAQPRPATRRPAAMLWALCWLVVALLALLPPATTILRRDLLWIGINTACTALAAGYVCWSLTRALTRSRRQLWLAIFSSAMLLSGAHLAQAALSGGGRPASLSPEALSWLAYLPASIFLCLLVAALAKEAVWLLSAVVRPSLAHSAVWCTRLSLVAILGGLGLFGVGAHGALRSPTVVEVDVSVANLPAELEGLRIVQLTDLHIGKVLGAPFVERIVTRVNRLAPDVVALTGDIVDYAPQETAWKLEAFRRLGPRGAVFYVSGNHEQKWGRRAWAREFRKLGITVLDGRRVDLPFGDSTLVVRGASYTATRSAGRRKIARGPVGSGGAIGGGAIGGGAVNRERSAQLLLVHHAHERFVDAVERSGRADLLLAGHTHGGQICPAHRLLPGSIRWVAGLHRHRSLWIYVSRGAGFWGPMLRLGAPSEITLLRLVRGEQRPTSTP